MEYKGVLASVVLLLAMPAVATQGDQAAEDIIVTGFRVTCFPFLLHS